jgi:hypothetical protein
MPTWVKTLVLFLFASTAVAALDITLELIAGDSAYNHWLWTNRAEYPDLCPVRVRVERRPPRRRDSASPDRWIAFLSDSGSTVSRWALPDYDSDCASGGRWNGSATWVVYYTEDELVTHEVGICLDGDELAVIRSDEDSTVSRVYDGNGRMLFACRAALERYDGRWVQVPGRTEEEPRTLAGVRPLSARGRPLGTWPVSSLDQIVSSGGGLHAANIEGFGVTAVFDTKGRVVWDTNDWYDAVISPEGRTLALPSGNELLLRNIKSGLDTTVVLPGRSLSGSWFGKPCIQWSDNGALLAIYQPHEVELLPEKTERRAETDSVAYFCDGPSWRDYATTDSGWLTVLSRTGATVMASRFIRGGVLPKMFLLEDKVVVAAAAWGCWPHMPFRNPWNNDSCMVTVVPFGGEPEAVVLAGVPWFSNAWRWRLLGRTLVCDGGVHVAYRIRDW